MKHTAWRRLRAHPELAAGPLGMCFAIAILMPCAVAAGQGPQTDAASGAVALSGDAIFHRRCSVCHGDHGQGIAAVDTVAGPSLRAEHDQADVIAAVEAGPGHMPAFSRILSVEQIRAVSDYVTTDLAIIPLMQGNIGEGSHIFRMYCATCHRTAVHGGVLAFAGRNAPDLTDKSSALIAGAIREGPGTMPSFPPTVLSDQQLASTVDYVRFVQHPPDPGGNPLKEMGPVAEGGLAALAVLVVIAIAGWIEQGGKG